MTIDANTLPAGRDTDKLVAQAIGWTFDPPDNIVGRRPEHPHCFYILPEFSTSDAALDALEQFQNTTGFAIRVSHNPGGRWRILSESDRPLSPNSDFPWIEAPTLWLAVCRLICGAMGEKA